MLVAYKLNLWLKVNINKILRGEQTLIFGRQTLMISASKPDQMGSNPFQSGLFGVDSWEIK